MIWKLLNLKGGNTPNKKAPTFVDALFTAPPPGLISNHLLKDLHDFHLLYKEIQAYQKSPSLN